MNRSKELLKNIVIFGLGTIGTKVFQMLLVPLFTIYLTTNEFSVADIISSTNSLITPILTLGISAGIFRYLLGQTQNEKSITKFACLISLGGTIFVALLLPLLNRIDLFGGYAYILPIMYGLSSFNTFISLICKAREKNIAYVIGGIIYTVVLSLLSLLFLAVFHWHVNGYLYAIVAAEFVSVLYFSIQIKLPRILYKAKIDRQLTKDLLKFSLPLVPNDLSWWVIQMSDRYMVAWICGASLNGIYSMAYKIPGIFNLLITIFNQAFGISAIKECDTEKTKDGKVDGTFFENIFKKFVGITFVSVVIVILLSRPLALVFLKKDFYQAWKYIPFLLIAYAIGNLQSFYVGILSGIKKTKVTGISTTSGMVINIGLNLFLIPRYEAYGAAVATIVGYMVVYLIRVFYIKKTVAMNNFFIPNILSIILVSVISVLYVSDKPILIGVSILLSIVVIIYYRKIIGELFRFFKRTITQFVRKRILKK